MKCLERRFGLSMNRLYTIHTASTVNYLLNLFSSAFLEFLEENNFFRGENSNHQLEKLKTVEIIDFQFINKSKTKHNKTISTQRTYGIDSVLWNRC